MFTLNNTIPTLAQCQVRNEPLAVRHMIGSDFEPCAELSYWHNEESWLVQDFRDRLRSNDHFIGYTVTRGNRVVGFAVVRLVDVGCERIVRLVKVATNDRYAAAALNEKLSRFGIEHNREVVV